MDGSFLVKCRIEGNINEESFRFLSKLGQFAKNGSCLLLVSVWPQIYPRMLPKWHQNDPQWQIPHDDIRSCRGWWHWLQTFSTYSKLLIERSWHKIAVQEWPTTHYDQMTRNQLHCTKWTFPVETLSPKPTTDQGWLITLPTLPPEMMPKIRKTKQSKCTIHINNAGAERNKRKNGTEHKSMQTSWKSEEDNASGYS